MDRSTSPFSLRSRPSFRQHEHAHEHAHEHEHDHEYAYGSSPTISSPFHRRLGRRPSPIPAPYRANTHSNRSGFCRRRFRSMAFLVIVVIVILLAWMIPIRDSLVMIRFKSNDLAFEKGWYRQGSLRKPPLLFVKGDRMLSIVWESNQGPLMEEMAMRWRPSQDPSRWNDAQVNQIRLATNRIVYSSLLQELQAGQSYISEIGWRSRTSPALNEERPTDITKLLSRHEFHWIGNGSCTIHVAALADNQFNVRTFHRILVQMLSYSSKSTRKPNTPDLIFHAGDQVQNPHDLRQWQTDFWDAMTSMLPKPLGQTVPIVLARGNHDWDRTGVNALTGGSPPRFDWLSHKSIAEKPKNHRGTFFAYSLHPRCRVVVLDSNLGPIDQVEQEEWFVWEMKKTEWKQATLKIVMVHVPPFLEYWDQRAWTKGEENRWSVDLPQGSAIQAH